MKEYKVTVEENDGTIKWYHNNKLHREDGRPAVECADGSKYWYLNDKLHREDGHAIECADGTKHWYINGKSHREDGPAAEYADGSKYWYLNGESLTEDKFNVKMNKNERTFRLNFFRRKNKKTSREDGPAIEFANGEKYWYHNGQLYRVNNGEKLTKEEFNARMNKDMIDIDGKKFSLDTIKKALKDYTH